MGESPVSTAEFESVGTVVTSSGGARTVLVVDTATDAVVTGIATITAGDDAARPEVTVLADRTVADHRRHAELLTTLIGETLTESGVARGQLDAVIAGVGPGPFTGLRVGMATAAAFGDALGLPVYGVCSLDAIAVEVARTTPSATTIAVATDARRREVYWALYSRATRIRGPEVAAPAAVAADLGGTTPDAVGGSAPHLSQIGWTTTEPASTIPTVSGLATAAATAVFAGAIPDPLVPLYLRRPDAVERKDQRPKTVTP
ncbi:tRNA (adenosine(37)-N6)-threonylcarbamoyltransferase complex dimerization subunit type 1 TsaB [Gordonia sp. NPDC003376]